MENMKSVERELTEIADDLGNALQDARKFDKGNDSAGTRVRKACQQARVRLFGIRNLVADLRHERSGEKAAA